jgi:hypothetical protein
MTLRKPIGMLGVILGLVLGMMGTLLAPATQAASITMPAGTTLTVRMADSIESDKNYAGETFRATVDTAVTINGKVAVPQGAEAIGRVTSVSQPGRLRGRAVVLLELTALNFDGKSIPILTSAHQETGGSRGKQTALYAGGGGLIGTVIGAIATGGAWFLIGSGIGVAGGTVVQAVRGSEPLRIPAESLMLFTVQSPVSLELEY